jgi:hypothetical protein
MGRLRPDHLRQSPARIEILAHTYLGVIGGRRRSAQQTSRRRHRRRRPGADINSADGYFKNTGYAPEKKLYWGGKRPAVA